MCVCIDRVSVHVYCVMFLRRDLNVFLAIGYSRLATNCKALMPVTGKFKKHFLKNLNLETYLLQVERVKCSLTNALGSLVTALKIL